ncbi:MAG: 5-formyltetrahydrofolate cyclo-ligase [Herpetosiphonaceae bacterium]|nr:5-formyltetrahydrofolate cyclo-ligase [Herpetosiphonaceae bacterium]
MADRTESEWHGRHAGKDAVRSEVWSALEQQGAGRGRGWSHIPNFVGAEQAAERLATLPVWQEARVVKSNPDSPQRPVRLRALQDGKHLYMAVPRLTTERCFVELIAEDLQRRGIDLETAATMQGALEHGRLVALDEMLPIDLVVTGCVAVSHDGGRTGKGAGFADLELGMLRQLHLIQPDTPIVTTVHALQVVEDGRLPMLAHDSALTLIVTPDEVINVQPIYPQPAGLRWEDVLPEQYQTIPALRKLREQLH